MTSLPVNIDTTYPDTGGADVKLHQQHHDTLHAQYNVGLLGPTVRTVSTSTYSVVDADVNNLIDCTNATSCTVTIPNSLTVKGAITVSKGAAGNVIIVAGSGVTLDKPASLTTLTTQYATMSAIIWGSLTHYRLAGAEL